MFVVAHLVDVGGAEALLAAGEPLGRGVCSPMKKGLNGTMPALVNSRVGSPAGINEAEGICWCPLLSKNFMKESLIWSPFIDFPLISTVEFSRCIKTAAPAERRGRSYGFRSPEWLI